MRSMMPTVVRLFAVRIKWFVAIVQLLMCLDITTEICEGNCVNILVPFPLHGKYDGGILAAW